MESLNILNKNNIRIPISSFKKVVHFRKKSLTFRFRDPLDTDKPVDEINRWKLKSSYQKPNRKKVKNDELIEITVKLIE